MKLTQHNVANENKKGLQIVISTHTFILLNNSSKTEAFSDLLSIISLAEPNCRLLIIASTFFFIKLQLNATTLTWLETS
jgi:hypothetical protein